MTTTAPKLGTREDEAKDRLEAPPPIAPVTLRRKTMTAEKGEGLWLMSFSDMSLLLMAFFVLQLAMSNPDRSKADRLKEAVTKEDSKGSLRHVSQELLTEIKKRNLGHLTEVSMDMNGLSIEFKDRSLFEPGSAKPDQGSLKAAEQIMAVLTLATGKYSLILEGHTDDVPLRNGRFKNNWELSSARATSLLEEFKRRGVDENKMAIRSYAHTKPRQSTDGLKGRGLAEARAQNRRVVIRLE